MLAAIKKSALLDKLIKPLPQFRNTCDMSLPKFNALSVTTPKEYVYQVQLNKPNKLNALDHNMWLEVGECFRILDDSAECRAIILSGAGRAFCAGIDLKNAMSMGQELAELEDVARKARLLEKRIKLYQDAFISIEKCRKPVIAAIHGLCVGGGFNMICAADIRYCSTNAWFSLKEVDIGMAADVGALQWLPKIIGSSSLIREWAFTGRKILPEEALESGLVNKLFTSDETLSAAALQLAEEISQKSPVAVQNTKQTLVYANDHTVQDGLDYIRNLNQTMLQSEDFINGAVAQATGGGHPTFSKL